MRTKMKDVLTTGQVAKICNVAPRTVSKWFDTGQLRGYRIPGSKDRRIPLPDLISFMKRHGIPLNGLDVGTTRVLLLDDDDESAGNMTNALEDDFEVRRAHTAFEAGYAVYHFRPEVMVVDVNSTDVSPDQLCRDLRSTEEFNAVKLVAIADKMPRGTGEGLLQKGFAAYLAKPVNPDELRATIDDLVR